MRIMIDLESWSTEGNASIRSIGACNIDNVDSMDEQEFYLNVETDLSAQDGRYHHSKSTREWWEKQPEDTQEMLAHDKVSPFEAMVRLSQWMLDIGFDPFNKDHEVWANGITFDITVLEHMFRTEEVAMPWGYGQMRDYRTIRVFYEDKGVRYDILLDDEGHLIVNKIEHHALEDAKYQSLCLIAMEDAFNYNT